jgi:NADH dehydrogenase (ubiquinone) 1 alpha subcomplex subunit 5
MFKTTLRLFAAQHLKPTTGLVGLPVQPRWREMMLKLCDDAIVKVRNEIPQGTLYRTATENNFKFFQKVIQDNNDYEVVEDILNRGQVEEVIMMMEDEITLISKMAEWKPWIVDDESIELEYRWNKNGNDYALPYDFVPPEMRYLKWDGIYNVEYTEEELQKLEQEKKEAADKAAAELQQQKK